MGNLSLEEFTKDIFNITENTVYDVLERFEGSKDVDKSLTYTFIKAFYLHSLKLYMENKQKTDSFETIYLAYKEELKKYYKNNNSLISDDLLNDLIESFDKCFEMANSIQFNDITSDYEFRHHIVDEFELLKIILENKSKAQIRGDMFENYISKFKREAEMIFEIFDNSRIIG